MLVVSFSVGYVGMGHIYSFKDQNEKNTFAKDLASVDYKSHMTSIKQGALQIHTFKSINGSGIKES